MIENIEKDLLDQFKMDFQYFKNILKPLFLYLGKDIPKVHVETFLNKLIKSLDEFKEGYSTIDEIYEYFDTV